MDQLAFHCQGRGGFRPGSGRNRGRRVTHHGRPIFAVPVPLHAVWRTREDVRSLRGKRLWRQLRESFRRCCEKEGFRLVHFSVQGTHVHLLVEAESENLLSRGMQGLGVSMAKRINRTLSRRGPAFEDRYFARLLRKPADVANAVGHVLHKDAYHLRIHGQQRAVRPDPFCSTAVRGLKPRLVAEAATWLLRVGYLRGRRQSRTPHQVG